MVNFKLGEEMRNDVINKGHEHGTRKNLSPLTGIEPLTFRTLVRCSNN